MAQPQQTVIDMVATIRGHWRRRRLICRVAAGLSAALVWLLLMVVLDNLAMLSPVHFVLGWLVLTVAALGWSGLLLHRRFRLRPTADRLALMYEARVPGQHNRLINAVQFLESRATRRDPTAYAAVIENAAALDRRSAQAAVDFRPVQRALILLVVCGFALLAYGVLRPQWTGNALSRLFHPLAPQRHLLATEPVVTPGDVALVEGAPLTIAARVPKSGIGRVPAGVHLEYRLADLDWVRTAMRVQPGGTYRYEFDAVRYPLAYRVRAGRSLSPTYRVTLQYRPRLARLQLTVRRPEYAGGGFRTLKPNVGDVAALEQSTVELHLSASVPLAGGSIALDGEDARPLEVSGSERRQAVGRFKLTRNGTYTIRLRDTSGLANLNPPRYTLTAEPDQPPLAIVAVPARDVILPASAALRLSLEAQDDIGLTRVELQTRHGNQPWQPLKQWRPGAGHTRRWTGRFPLALAAFGLEAEDVLLYRLVAWDNRRPRPNVGIGHTWSVTIAAPSHDKALLAAQTRRLLAALRRILALQHENRTALDLDRKVEPIRARQRQVRQLTSQAIDDEAKAIRPTESVITELSDLADGLMLAAMQQLADYGGDYQQRIKKKNPILGIMDEIIARLEALIGRVERALGAADRAQDALEQLPPEERDQALKHIRDLLEKLRDFIPEQDRIISDTKELARRGEDLTDDELEKLERLKGTEDLWAQVFTDAVRDIAKLTEQGFADTTIANDYKEMVEQIEAASLNLTPELIQLAVPREQAGRELAETLVEEMEMWLPNSPDHIQWLMEEPLDLPEIPMVDLPDQLWDLIGDLIEDQDELNDAAEDMTSAWADSIAEGAGWEVAGGPISNFSAVGKTGNQLPDNNELSGRSGDGRSGRSQGQLVENVAKGLKGRNTPTRVTNDPYEKGVVKELQQMATGGATGGGKARGAGQEGLQGQSPPPLMANMQFMTDWQQRIRQKAERVAGQLNVVRISVPELDRAIALMEQAEQAGQDGRYAELFKIQQMVLQNLRMSGELAMREMALRVDRAYHLPAEQRRRILDAMDEPVPEEYRDAVRRYFQQLSESE